MVALWIALIGCGAGDCATDPDCEDPTCAATCDADGDGAIAAALGGDDCDDHDSQISPGATEICSGLDEDCDGLIDDLDPDLDLTTTRPFYLDGDGDGFGPDEDPILGCSVAGRVPNGGDCDDTNPAVAPGATDVCDSIADNDCDGVADPSEFDDDGDGLADCAGDCDDARPDVSPAATEICNDGVDDDCDGLLELDDPSANPWTCGFCPPAVGWMNGPIDVETFNPCVLDPTNTTWGCSTDPKNPDTNEFGTRLHRVAVRSDLEHYRPQLLLWFPPGPGEFNVKVLKMAAWAGYRSILIGYPNEGLAWGEPCARDLGDCYSNGRQEILWGDDLSPYLSLAPGDSAIGRVLVLLQTLDLERPGEGWGDYVAPTGDDLVWENTVVMGWSEGGTNLGWLTHEVEPYGAIFLSSPEDVLFDVGQDLASFYYTPFATPGCAMWGAYHAQEPNDAFKLSFDEMDVAGPALLLENSAPPYGGSHRLLTYLTADDMSGCTFHKAIAYDPCMSSDLGEPYIHMLCSAGDNDREIACPWVP